MGIMEITDSSAAILPQITVWLMVAAGLSQKDFFVPIVSESTGYAVNYLVDANVLSEATKAKPDARVVDWLRQNESAMWWIPLLWRIRFGIYLLPSGKRRRRLETWFKDGVAKITCLPWGAETGLRWAKLLADLRSAGKAMPIKDSFIAHRTGSWITDSHTQSGGISRPPGVKLLDPFSGKNLRRAPKLSRKKICFGHEKHFRREKYA